METLCAAAQPATGMCMAYVRCSTTQGLLEGPASLDRHGGVHAQQVAQRAPASAGRGASGARAAALPGPRGGACPCDRLRLGAPPSGARRPASSSTCRSRPGATRSPAPGSISVRGGAAAPRQHTRPLGSRHAAGAALVWRRGRRLRRASSETCAQRSALVPCKAGTVTALCAWRLRCRSTRSGPRMHSLARQGLTSCSRPGRVRRRVQARALRAGLPAGTGGRRRRG